MKMPNILDEQCGAQAGGCADARCSDPGFSAANPGMCPKDARLVIGPERVMTCTSNGINFTAVMRSGSGDVPVSEGLTWSSSNPAAMTINALSGQASAVAAGTTTISATWQGYSAFAQVTVLGTDGTCCSSVTALIGLALDNSLSMGQPYDGGYASKLDAAKAMARAVVGVIESKDLAGVMWFNDTVGVMQGLTDSVALLQSGVDGIQPSENGTDVSGAFEAVETLLNAGTGNIRVMLIISDGASHPTLGSQEWADVVDQARAFKAAGNVICCVGVKASGEGYRLLETIASGGFFLNVWGGAQAVQDAISKLECSLGYFCSGTACNEPIGSQNPDPAMQWDLEDGDPSLQAPLLPAVSFTPLSSSERGGGLEVQLSVIGHPDAEIRYSMDGTNSPPDPAFGGVGTDYVGAFSPVRLPGGGPASICIKAIAREPGFRDSQVSVACYNQSSSIPGQLGGLRWELPITHHSGELVGLCADPSDKSLVLQGDTNVIYNVTLRFRGIVEPFTGYTGTVATDTKAYQNLKKPGDTVPKLYEYDGGSFVTGGSFPSNTTGTTYALVVSDPPQTYYLNGVPTAALDVPEGCMMIDYQETIQIRTGATVTLQVRSHDGQEVVNTEHHTHGDIEMYPLFVPDVSPYPDLSLGQFIQMDVVAVASSSIAGQLSGLRWDMPIVSQTGTFVGTCVNPADQTVTLQGDSGTVYNVTIRFRGVVEPFSNYTGTPASNTKAYQNLQKPGDSAPKLYEYDAGSFITGGSFPSNTVGNTYALIISDPPQTYYLNAAPTTPPLDVPQTCMMIDYQETIQIRGGATVTLHADGHDGLEVANGSGMVGSISVHPLVVPNVPPYPSASLGQFIQMDVISVT